MPAPAAWLDPFLDALNVRAIARAQVLLGQALADTAGMGPGWDQALAAAIQGGWVEGARAMLEQGLALPSKAPRPGRSACTLRQQAIVACARLDPDAHTPLPPHEFCLPDGTPCQPLSGRAAVDLARVLCQPPAPALTPCEWATAWTHARPLARTALSTGHVRPWGGAAACRVTATALATCFSLRHTPQEDDDMSFLLEHLPTGMPAHATPVLSAALAHLARTAGSTVAPRLTTRVSDTLDTLAACGRPLGTVAGHARKHLKEDLFILAIRCQDPAAFARLLHAGQFPWTSRSCATSQSRPDPLVHGSIFDCLADRLRQTIDPEVAERWWELIEQLAATPEGARRMARTRHRAPASLALANDRQRWATLAQATHLGRRLPAVLSAPAVRPRL